MMPQYDWSPGEAAGVNEFLSTPLGQKWLGYLMFLKPPFDQASSDRAALSGAFRAGYEQCVGAIQYTRRPAASGDVTSAKGIDPTRD
jgi:hypothetical protein